MKTEKQKFKSIRIKTAVMLTIMFVCLAATIYLVLNTVMLDRINILENQNIAGHTERVTNTIDTELDYLSKTAFDWAEWDETYGFTKDKNEGDVEDNLQEATFSNLKINVMAFINESGGFVLDGEADLAKKEMKPISQAFIEYISESPIVKNTDPNYKIKGLIMLPEGPMLIATCPILLSSQTGSVRGNIVIGRYLDDAEVSLLSSNLKLNLAVKRLDQLDQKNSSLFDSITSESPVLVKVLNNDKIGGYSILKDIYGKPQVGVSIEMGRDISMIGRSVIKVILISLIAVSFIFAMLILVFLDKNILFRLLALSREIKNIGSKRSFSIRLKPQKMCDELAVVSDEINNMLDELEKSQILVVESKENLKKLNEVLENRVHERTIELSKANESLQEEIIEREKIQEKIKHLAYHDHLTGLPNRLMFTDQLNHAICLSKRMGKMIGVMFLDLDGFKKINDTMGHAIGDKLLVEVSKRLVNTLRQCDIVSRIGGDEFIIMIENIESIDSINIVADKILQGLSKPFTIENQACFLTTSIGVSAYPKDGENAEVLIKNADIAMYKAKEKGRNQCIIWTPVMKTKIIETMKMTNKLYRALEWN